MPNAGGCDFAENPDLPAGRAAVFWLPSVNPRILPIVAAPARPGVADAFDLEATDCHVTVLQIDGLREHAILDAGSHPIQLALMNGTLLHGPVEFRYDLQGFNNLDPKLASLHQLIRLIRFGSVPAVTHQRAHRWVMALRAIDLVDVGASYRDIAVDLFGSLPTRRSWRIDNDHVRNRVRRVVRLGQEMVAGGYRGILQS